MWNSKLAGSSILEAAERAGDKEGLTGYLERQARENPGPFMTLLGKVLPLQLSGDERQAVSVTFE